jgi:hypothetical protein
MLLLYCLLGEWHQGCSGDELARSVAGCSLLPVLLCLQRMHASPQPVLLAPPLSFRCSKNTTFGAGDVLELVTLLDSGAAAPYAVGTEAGASTSRQPDSVVRPSRCVHVCVCVYSGWMHHPDGPCVLTSQRTSWLVLAGMLCSLSCPT